MIVVPVGRYTSGLSAQLSVQPAWTNREYLAAINGHAFVQLPATAVRAEVTAVATVAPA